MDFFQQQDRARRKTKWLVLYLALAVILISVAIYPVIWGIGMYAGGLRYSHHYHGAEAFHGMSFWNPWIFLGSFVVTLTVILLGSAYKMNALSGGGAVLAASLGGRLVPSNTKDPDERKLLNVVEEMAIASGIAVPQVFVLDDEQGINAFAAGHTTNDAVVAVTHGAMRLLSRDELQGVIGHEFSHVLNGDMRLNIRLIGILFGILCLATIGRIFMRARGRNSGGIVAAGALLWCIGCIGVFFGRLIQAAISRQREFLADASSVQFTRNPAGLSGALQKIGGYGFSSWLTSEQAPDAGHLFFGNGSPRVFFNALSTHPPLENRIRAIDPAWDGKFPVVKPQADSSPTTAKPAKDPHAFFFGNQMIVLGGAAAMEEKPTMPPRHILPNVGNPTPMHLRYAEKLRDAMPENVKAAAREPLDAVALVYAMLLSCDEAERTKQLAELSKRIDPAVQQKTVALFPDVSQAAAHAQLPMINLATGALRQLTPEQFETFSATLDWLVNCDGKIELFEFVVQKIVCRSLAPRFRDVKPPVVQYYTIKPLVPHCVIVLSALAHVGTADLAEAGKAFEAGAPYLRAPDGDFSFLPLAQCGIDEVDDALNRLALAVPQIKRNLIEACVHTVGADGVITEEEAELLRAVADTLDCPIPPFVTTE